jgi:hypothetical protein
MILMLTGLLIGFLVSLIEAACTGQVYVPILASLVKMGQVQALGYLLVYNLVFIAPLIIILGLSFWGVSSQSMQGFFKNRLGAIKLLTAILFFVMAGFLLVG